MAQQNEPIEIKEISGLVVSPGSKPITLQMPTILEIKIPNNLSGKITIFWVFFLNCIFTKGFWKYFIFFLILSARNEKI